MTPCFAALSSHRVLALSGSDREAFLGGLCTQDLTTNKPAHYTLLLNAQGRYLFELFVYPQPEALLLEGPGNRMDALREHLSFYRLRSRIGFAETDWGVMWCEQMPKLPLPVPALCTADPRGETFGARILVAPEHLLALQNHLRGQGLQEISEAEAFNRAMAQGLPRDGAGLESGRTLPLEANMDALNAISFSKGCYMGQELTARMHHRKLVNKRLLPISDVPPQTLLETPLMAGEKEAGELRVLNGTQALALIRLEAVILGNPITCNDKPITLHWPAWLPHD